MYTRCHAHGRPSYRCRASAKEGQLAKKSLRGLMRRRRRRISRSNPLPPLSLVLQSKNPIPYDVHCASLWVRRCGATACKGRPNQVGETTEMVHGEVAFGVPMGRTAGRTRRGRGRAVIVYNPEDVTHMLRTRTISAARTHSHALRTFAPHIAPAPYHSHATRASSELHARTHRARTALHAFLCLSSLFCCVLISKR